MPQHQAALPGLLSDGVEEAEGILLSLADYLYANSGLKPMSKTLFAISRFLLVVHEEADEELEELDEVVSAYEAARKQIGASAPRDDYSFEQIAQECKRVLPRILADLRIVWSLTRERDALGLVFNTLLRGKWDSGEGLGTFLTPEEVVEPMVSMALVRNTALWASDDPEPGLFGDICCGTGRFLYSLTRQLIEREVEADVVGDNLRGFDQSSLAVDLARLNLYFSGFQPHCEVVDDSLTEDSISALQGSFAALATNPPFGASKYEAGRALRRTISSKAMNQLEGNGDTFDPAALFVFRNLDLLRPGGVLAIVLPDGLIQSESFLSALRAYDSEVEGGVEVRALISLPPVTFTLGGTVAKTSFLVISRESQPDSPLFIGEAKHVGFRRRGNRRIPDPQGSDLPTLVQAYEALDSGSRYWGENWRKWRRLGIAGPKRVSADGPPLRSLGREIRDFRTVGDSDEEMHVSVLHVDETGLLDIGSVMTERPSSRVVECQPGDVIVSCINPRIWRVAVIPEIPGRWTCSPEFLVVRPKDPNRSWELYLRLQQPGFIEAVQGMAGGTSSSRQRVQKSEVLDLSVPESCLAPEEVDQHRQQRGDLYRLRMAELDFYEGLQK